MLILSFLCLIFSVANIDCILHTVCDGMSVHITCEPGMILHIINTYYCSENLTDVLCLESRDQYCCKPDYSYNVVSHLCDNEQCCVFPVAPYMFAGSCPPETKCLTLNYTCEHNDSTSTKCRKNEEWSECRSACPIMCPALNNTQPTVCTKQCVCPGYQCKTNYRRDQKTGICILEELCPKPGEKNIMFSRCANNQKKCKTDNTTTERIKCCQSGYRCIKPYVIDPLGNCVEEKDCPVCEG